MSPEVKPDDKEKIRSAVGGCFDAEGKVTDTTRLQTLRTDFKREYLNIYSASQVDAVISQVGIQRARLHRKLLHAPTTQPAEGTLDESGGPEITSGNQELTTVETEFQSAEPIAQKYTTEEDSVAEVEDSNDDKPSALSGAEHFDYDFESKRKWRTKWKEFLDSRLPKNSRARGEMKVLCLPGKKCLEIPLYTELGLRPENIVGVEGGDEEARQEFLINAQRLGIQVHLGDLLDFCKKNKTEFDVVSLDFPDMMDSDHLSLYEEVLTKKKSWALVNELAKRERKPVSAFIKFSSAVFSVEDMIERKDWDTLADLMNAEEDELTETLMQARNKVAIQLFLAKLGTGRVENHLSARATDLFELFRSDLMFTAMRARFEVRDEFVELLRRLGYGGQRSEFTGTLFKMLIDWGTWGQVMPTNLEQYYYTNPKHSPFNSSFVELERPMGRYRNAEETIHFIMDAVIHRTNWLAASPTGMRGKGAFAVRRGASTIDSWSRVKETDELQFISEGKRLSRVSIKTLSMDIGELWRVYEKQIYSDEMEKRTKII